MRPLHKYFIRHFNPVLLYTGIILSLILAFLSVFSAFIGADRAHEFFYSPPLMVYWFVLGVFLILSIIGTGYLKRIGLFVATAGGILLLIGSMVHTRTGHRFFLPENKNSKIIRGRIILEEGKPTDMVYTGLERFRELPFSIELNEFRIERHEETAGAAEGQVKQYISDIRIVKESEVLASGRVRVNHPLRYGGYIFYQQSYLERDGQRASVLQVVSDTGLGLVYTGLVTIVLGVLWCFWLVPTGRWIWEYVLLRSVFSRGNAADES